MQARADSGRDQEILDETCSAGRRRIRPVWLRACLTSPRAKAEPGSFTHYTTTTFSHRIFGFGMLFIETKLKGAFIIELDRREDARGFFARAFCQEEFAAHGCNPVIAQANIGFNRYKGTLRGMHFQFPPAAETKLVRASRGAVFDVIVDLRPESPTYPPAHRGGAQRRQSSRHLHSWALRARLPGARGRHRNDVSDGRGVHARLRRVGCRTTIRRSNSSGRCR